jgi:subtilisin family serine protease/photosystem II stability/assembly factor-like uncharacterized protein
MVVRRSSPDTYLPGRIAIKLRSAKGQRPQATTAVIAQLAAVGLRSVEPLLDAATLVQLQHRSVGLESVLVATFDPGFDPFDVAAALVELPEVEYATPLYIRRIVRQPNDPQFSQQSALQRIQMPAAWDVTIGSPEITIAIIDSGTDYEHEDLAANLWTNPGETGTDAQGRDKRSNGIDDDGNGKIDDWRGWDFIGNVTRAELLAGTIREDNDPKIRAASIPAEMQHGTQTAGAAIAVTNNGRGIASPAGYRCRFIPIKCGSDDQSLAGAVLRGYDAILYAARLGASVINCSWGGPIASPLEQQIIDQARALGSLVVAATGNDGINLDAEPFYPACYVGVLAVGASNTTTDQVAGFTNYGTRATLYAPGTSIRTTGVGNSYTTVDGTSFAAPLTSGVAALLRSLHPDWTIDQLIAQLRYTCDRLSGTSDALRPRYYGRLNAARALGANQSFASGDRVSGVQALAATVNGSPTITTTAPGTLEIRLRNLLAPATNVRVQLSVSPNAQLGTTTLQTSNLGTLEERTLQTTFTLTSPTYFFDDTVHLSLVITADGIVEYAQLSLRVALPTQNTYVRQASRLPHHWRAVAMRGLAGTWAVGQTPSGRGLVYRSSGTVFDSTSITSVPTTLAIASNAVVCVGTENGVIWRTSNGGNSWTSTNLGSTITAADGLVFFDATTGICIGRPSGGGWRLARTTDAGATWSVAASLPSPLGTERTTHHAIASVGDTVWVGTSSGRVLRSTNRGTTWTAAQAATTDRTITAVAFANGQLGYCLVRPSAQWSNPTFAVYRSLDGGLTWVPTGAQFHQSVLEPLALYAPPYGRGAFMVCAGSQVLRSADSGTTWEPVLTGNGGICQAATGSTSGQSMTLAMAGATIATLRVSIADDRPILRITPSDSLDFGTVRLDSSAERTLVLANIGGAPLIIDSISIEPLAASSGEFNAQVATPLVINPNGSQSITLRFAPRQSGERRARLVMSTNTSPAVAAVVLHGVGTTPSSIAEPVPAVPCSAYGTGAFIAVECACGQLRRLELWQLRGQHVMEVTVPPDQIWLDATHLPRGTYLCRISCGDRIEWSGIVVLVP